MITLIGTARLSNGALQLLATDAAHNLWSTWKVSPDVNAAWTDWLPFGGQAKQITSGNLPNGAPVLWIIGTDNRLYSNWKVSDNPDADWTGWGDPEPGAPPDLIDVSAVRLSNGV